jgi:hypothetical protein
VAAAVASIAVGQTIGVAPGADLYYIATARGGRGEDFAYLARSIRRILGVNQQLPEERRIRVISMAIGWRPDVKGYNEVTSATEEAKAAGMLVVCSSIEQVHGFKFHGLGRAPLGDPEVFESYEPGLWWAERFYGGERFSDRLLVPMDSRTTAGPLAGVGPSHTSPECTRLLSKSIPQLHQSDFGRWHWKLDVPSSWSTTTRLSLWGQSSSLLHS